MSKRVKVLEVCYSLKAGGIESFVTNVFKHMDRERFEVHFLVTKGYEENFYGQAIESLGGIIQDAGSVKGDSISRWFEQRRKYREVLEREHYDIVHVHASIPAHGLDVEMAHRAGVAHIAVHSHCAVPDPVKTYGEMSHGGLRQLVGVLGQRYIDKYAGARLACSRGAAEWLFPGRSDVTIMKNGIDTAAFAFDPAARDEIRARYGLDAAFVIGTVGRLSPQKNQAFLLSLMARLLPEHPEARLMVVGGGPLEADLRQQAGELGIGHAVVFTGTTKQVAGHLSAMDLFVLPSNYEGLSIVTIEAQASGLCCLISENIPDEAAVLKTTAYLPLRIDAWADAVDAAMLGSPSPERASASVRMARCGWDIADTAKAVQDLYLRLLMEGRDE